MSPRLSVLICACDRPAKLHRLLTDLQQQTLPSCEFEVFVSDDGSIDPAQESVLSASWPFDLQVIRGPRKGPAEARNRALPYLKAPICLLLNDDLRAAPNLLETHLRLQDSHQGKALAQMGTFEFTDELRQDLFHRTVEDLGLIGTRRINSGAPLGPEFFWTGNMSLRTEDLHAVGGLDRSFSEPKGDDVDLGLRLMTERGIRLRLSHQARAWHDHHHTLSEWWERSRMVGRAQRRITEKHLDPHFCPGSGAVLHSGHEFQAARNRLLAQRIVGEEMMRWTENLVDGHPPTGKVVIESLARQFDLPEDHEKLLRVVVAGATHFLFQEGFWTKRPSPRMPGLLQAISSQDDSCIEQTCE